MSDLPPLPSEDINDGEIRVFTYRHLREYAAIARQQGRDEMREWTMEKAAKMVEQMTMRQRLMRAAGDAKPVQPCESAAAIRSIGTPKSAEGEEVITGPKPVVVNACAVYALCESIEQDQRDDDYTRGMRTMARRIRKEVAALATPTKGEGA